MSIFQIQGALGGCGASAVAWTVAQQVRAAVAVDFSAHQGGLAWCATGDVDVSWPRILAADIQRDELFSVSRQVGQVRICSGGEPPPQSVVDPVLLAEGLAADVVVDGGNPIDVAHRLSVMPNHLRAMKRLRNYSGWILCSVRSDGVPTKLVQKSLAQASIIFFKQQSSVQKSLQLGYALPRNSSMRTAVDQWLSQLAL